jgi:PAS domain S-box-containing protein
LTSRPRLLLAPALLAAAVVVVLAVSLAYEPGEAALASGLLVAALLVLAAAVAGVWASRRLTEDLGVAQQDTDASATLVDDLFSAVTSDVLVATDGTGHITRFNPGAERVLGVTAAAALGRTPSFFLEEAEVASWALAMRTEQDFAAVAAGLVASQQQQPLEWPFFRPDGERRFLSLSISTIRDGGGERSGFLLVGQDVTDLVRTESGTEQFLATMSLELRAPMASIIGYAEMLHEELDGQSASARSFVDRIERSGHRMLMLIQDLLTLTRVEDPELELQRDEVDLRSIVTTAYDAVHATLDDRRLDLALRLPPDPVVQECDSRLVEQVVHQLLANAAKFTPDGGRVIVSVKAGATNRIVVGDTGIGISQTDRERLFTRFFRSHQTEVQQRQGSGLGLAIVKAVVEAHGGTITVESELGRGSTFVVELPGRPPAPIRATEATEVTPASPSMSA